MNASNFLSVKDFFNYYVAGLLWILEVAIISMPLSSYQKSLDWLGKFQGLTDKMGAVLTGILFIVIPYLVGFVFTPISMAVTKMLRALFGDPKEWIVDYSEKGKRYEGKRLAQTKIRLIIAKMKEVFGDDEKINEKNLRNWFFTLRDYIINGQGDVASLAIRTQDLFNFTESIILPLPAFVITIGIKLCANSMAFGWALGLLGLIFFGLLSYRYLKLRFYWVKHVYNSFLVVTSAKPISGK